MFTEEVNRMNCDDMQSSKKKKKSNNQIHSMLWAEANIAIL